MTITRDRSPRSTSVGAGSFGTLHANPPPMRSWSTSCRPQPMTPAAGRPESRTRSQAASPLDWRRLYAFGWPEGSVRALMALIVFGCLWCFLVLHPDQEVPEYLRDLLFIILGHYFAVRSRQPTSTEAGPPPLYLPRGSVRVILVAGFVVTAVLLYRQGRLLEIGKNPAVVTLFLAAGFILGVVAHQVWVRLTGGRRRLPRILEDIRALVSLAATIFLVVLIWDQFAPQPFQWGLDKINLGLGGKLGLPHVAAAIVGFYFGSRS